MKLKNAIVSIILSAAMLFVPTISVFAATNGSTEAVLRATDEVETGEAIETEIIMSADNPEELQGDFEKAPILKGNRYYYTVVAGVGHGFPVHITKKQASVYNDLRKALIAAITVGLGEIGVWAKALVNVFADYFAGIWFETAKAEGGTYTGHVYPVTRYKVDSLTGKKTKVARGVRTKIPVGGITYTKTCWE